jgi:BirA family transcriptional regulator, biotin operon repressor / biotin---[acetyl-CoA-carboxylase] ligase
MGIASTGKLTPSGSSAAHAVASVGAQFSAGPPPGKSAPSGGSAAHEVASVGAQFSAGPPPGKLTPSGGSVHTQWESVGAILPGFTVEILPEIDSTNSELMRRAKSGLTAPVLLVARPQTAGRGRLGRTWLDGGKTAEPSVLMFSLGLELAPANWSGLSLAVGMAVARSLHPDLRLKWPNDIWWEERKLGGILIETVALGGLGNPSKNQAPARYAVIGIGINISARGAQGLSTAPAWLQELHPGIDSDGALQRIAAPLVGVVKQFEQTGFAPFQTPFNHLDALDRRTVALSDGSCGVAMGVDETGALRVQTETGMVKITSSEISVRPQAAARPD